MVNVDASAGDEDFVPADWRIYLSYSYNTVGLYWPGSGTLHLETWVEEYTDADTDII